MQPAWRRSLPSRPDWRSSQLGLGVMGSGGFWLCFRDFGFNGFGKVDPVFIFGMTGLGLSA